MEWQDIATAPKDRWILVAVEYENSSPVQVAKWVDTSDWVWEEVDSDTRKRIFRESGYWGGCDGWPTHWMPLPAPPDGRLPAGEKGK